MTHEERLEMLKKEREHIDARFNELMERSNKASTIEKIDEVHKELNKLALECIRGLDTFKMKGCE